MCVDMRTCRAQNKEQPREKIVDARGLAEQHPDWMIIRSDWSIQVSRAYFRAITRNLLKLNKSRRLPEKERTSKRESYKDERVVKMEKKSREL